MNASLQAMYHIPALATYFRNRFESSQLQNCRLKSTSCLHCSVLLTYILTRQGGQGSVVAPKQIWSKLGLISNELLTPGLQEDSHEFIG